MTDIIKQRQYLQSELMRLKQVYSKVLSVDSLDRFQELIYSLDETMRATIKFPLGKLQEFKNA